MHLSTTSLVRRMRDCHPDQEAQEQIAEEEPPVELIRGLIAMTSLAAVNAHELGGNDPMVMRQAQVAEILANELVERLGAV